MTAFGSLAKGLTRLKRATARQPGFLARQFKQRPVTAGLVTADAGVFGYQEAVRPLAEGFSEEYLEGAKRREQLFEGMDVRRELLARQAELEALQQNVARNMATLAAVDPDLYTSVLAGRRLPPGMRVYGGQPRTDLLEDLAMQMAAGQFKQPSAEEELMALITGGG